MRQDYKDHMLQLADNEEEIKQDSANQNNEESVNEVENENSEN